MVLCRWEIRWLCGGHEVVSLFWRGGSSVGFWWIGGGGKRDGRMAGWEGKIVRVVGMIDMGGWVGWYE